MKRKEMIKDKKVFNNIIRYGQFQKNKYYVLYQTNSSQDNPMYGIAISKKVGKANIRNRIKRQTRSIIDNNRKLFSNKHNYIIMIRKSCVGESFTTLENALTGLIRKER